jgi:hypothetical protein
VSSEQPVSMDDTLLEVIESGEGRGRVG